MRLDEFLVRNGYYESRNKAKNSIVKGEVVVNGKTVLKPSFDISTDCNIELRREKCFVSEGGFKLDKAINDFSFFPKDLVCADIGASTGGFTDCLLLYGAKKVYAVDLNDELLHESLKGNEKVIPIIKNARELSLKDFNDKIDLLTADLSFISVSYVLPIFSKILNDGAYAIILIKPQFETEKRVRLKNGIIKDKELQISACKKIYDAAIEFGFSPQKITTAPIKKEKNVEFLMLLKKGRFEVFSSKVFENI